MATCWISFRLEKNAAYQARYDNLMESIEMLDESAWVGTTSFCVIETGLDAGDVASELGSAIDEHTDGILVGEFGSADVWFTGYIDEDVVLGLKLRGKLRRAV